MKKFLITMISIFAALAIGLVVLMVLAIQNGGILPAKQSSNVFKTAELVNTQEISLDGIDEITLNYTWDDIIFLSGNTGKLIFKEYMNFTPDDDDLTQITTRRNRLKLERQQKNRNYWFGDINRYSKVEIYLPSDYSFSLTVNTTSGNIESDISLNLTNFEASSSSGDIKIAEVYAASISVASSSGNITMERAEGSRSVSSSSGDIKLLGGAGDSSVSSTSGNIIIENSTGILNASASSGDISISNSSGRKDLETTSGKIVVTNSDGYTEASASSGDIRFTGFNGAADFETTSGSIILDYAEGASIEDDINLHASSGDVTLTLPSGLSFDFSANSSSGDIRTSFDDQLKFSKNENHASGTIGSNPLFALEITTTSGNIRISDDR